MIRNIVFFSLEDIKSSFLFSLFSSSCDELARRRSLSVTLETPRKRERADITQCPFFSVSDPDSGASQWTSFDNKKGIIMK